MAKTFSPTPPVTHLADAKTAKRLEIYRRIFDSSHDAIGITDAQGRYLQQNPAQRELIGYSDEELEGQTPALYMGKEVFAKVAAELARTGHYDGEIVIRTRQGETRKIELSAFTILDHDGQVLCHVGVKRDISARKGADEELKTRLRQQAVVAELGREALSGGELGTLLNNAARQVTQTLGTEFCKVLELLPGGRELRLRAGAGFAPELIGHATESNDLGSHAGFTLRSSEPVILEDLTSESRFRAPALLRDRGVRSGIDVIIQAEGQVWGVLGTHTAHRRKFTQDDINFLQAIANVLAAAIDRKRAEEALRQSQARFRVMQRGAGIALYEWDLRTGRIVFSEQLPVLSGLCPEGKIEAWLERLHPEDRKRIVGQLREIAQRGEFDIQFRLLTEGGETLWLVTRGQIEFENHRPAHAIGILMDITARKNAEELLQRSEKLAMVGRLAASIAHEINNPLEAVTNLLYLIERHPALDGQAREFSRLAQRELSRVSHISRQTLGFYRESASPVPVNLSELLDDILKLYERKIDRRNVRVVKRYKLNRDAVVFAAEIRQVVSNLVINALEATDPGGTLTVAVQEGVDWAHPERRGVRLIIADTGHGIAAEHRKRIFEAFFTSKGEKGTGLGLWVTNGIVQKHGGSIRLRSSTGPQRHGTVFSIFLPETSSAASAGAPLKTPVQAA
jgi:PAS domain S-box-containing protein